MSKHEGLSNLVSKALLYESKGKRVSQKFINEDRNALGYINTIKAAGIICDILRIPAPLGLDQQSTDARNQILTHCSFMVVPHPDIQGQEVVEYDKFLKAFRRALRTTPLIATNPYVHSDLEREMKARNSKPKKNDMTEDEINKAIDMNLPKYYRSTTEAFLKMKPPGGKMRLPDFARFMRSINLDLTDEMLQRIFKKYDKNHNGALDAWEFFDGFGGSISGHQDSSTSLFMEHKLPFKEPTKVQVRNLDAKETCELIKARLPFHFKSSTKAFLAAKGGANPRSNTIGFKDLKLFMQNLNIIVPDDTIRGLFKYMDDDDSGGVNATEFIKFFGHAISGEKADNIQDSDHLSFHNLRPENRVPIVPPKHKWTYDEVKQTLGDRLGMIHTSSTVAFMKAKRSNSRFMTHADLRRILMNLNIDAPEHISRRIFNDMDGDGSGEIECSEFLQYFGSHINGFAGSFETKPDWFYKELSDLSAHIDRIDGVHNVPTQPETVYEEPEEEKPKKKVLSKAQEAQFMRKFGITAEEMMYLNNENESPVQNKMNVNNLEFAPSPLARPQSAGRDRPRSASSERPRSAGPARPKSAGSNRPHSSGGETWSRRVSQASQERPRSASKERPRSASNERPRSADPARRPQSTGRARPRSARDIQHAVNFSQTMINEDDPFAPIVQGLDTRNTYTKPETNSPGKFTEFSDGELLDELRTRKLGKTHGSQSRSAPRGRPELPSGWVAPTSTFGGFNQGPHYKSTVAAKLKTAKKVADMLEKRKDKSLRKSKAGKKSRGGRYDSGRESKSVMFHELQFRF